MSIASLGRELLITNIPLEEVVELHEKALNHMAGQSPNLTLLNASRRISIPLMELFMAYSLSWRQQSPGANNNQPTNNSLPAAWLGKCCAI